LRGQTNASGFHLIQQIAALQHRSSCDSFAVTTIYDTFGPITTIGANLDGNFLKRGAAE
jgi:hypothetical protein